MTLRLEDKKVIVKEVAEVAGKAISAVAADYRGLSVSQMTQLRAKAREQGIYLRVVRNNLARRAFEGTDFACMQDSLVGPLVLAFSIDDPGASARLIKNFAKENEQLEAKFLSIGGKLLDGKDLNTVASLPTLEEALGRLAAVMQAPITKFVRTMAEPHGKLVRTIAAVKEQKQAVS